MTANGLRRLILGLAAATFAGATLELWFADHTQETLQLLPFAICLAGTLVVMLFWLRRTPASLWLLRAVMVAAIGVSALGVYEHLHANYEFEREIRPNASAYEVAERALHGVAPALAPGSLALAALLALGVSWSPLEAKAS